MTITSNSYAEKVFAEHPIALWSLDEQADYISLVTENDRDMRNGWVFKDNSNNTLTPSTVATSYENPDTWLSAFPDSLFQSYANQLFYKSYGQILKTTSPVLFQDEEVDLAKTFTLSLSVFTFNKVVSIALGYEYTDANSQVQRETKTIDLLPISEWQNVSESFHFPNVFSDLKIVFEITYSNSFVANDYILLHGMTMGQWSEQFNVESLGVSVTDIPDSIPIDAKGVGAKSYGLQDVSGYYLATDKNILSAVNSGVPMVFGADSSTRITKNTGGLPSLILPGYGIMNSTGQYSDLTLEMWLKIQSSATVQRRIVGPIASSDGLYVNDSFLVLKVGPYNGAYYVGEWDRPMLVAIRLTSVSASLVINGEEVITLTLDPTKVSFVSKYDENGKDQDWIGFYAYDDVPLIELDCVGIYPYEVPAIVEKKRWVYGQAIEISDTSNSFGLSSTMSVDYSVSRYAKNYMYPDIGRWKQGIQENIVVDNLTLSLPQYALPSIVLSNKTVSQWYADNAMLDFSIFGEYATIRPNSNWDNTSGYLYFENLNILQEDVKAFYGLFESKEGHDFKQTLFLLENTVTAEYLEISLEGSDITYTYHYLANNNGVGQLTSELLHTDNTHQLGDFLFVGIDIARFAQHFGGRVANFLGSKQQIKLYVAGKQDFLNTFTGNIYRIGFCTARNLEKISNVFTNNGLPAGFNAFDQNYVADAGAQYFGNDMNYISPTTGQEYWSRLFDGGDEYFGNSSVVFDDEIDGGNVYSLLVSSIISHIASYTIIPKLYLGNFILDIGVNSYWQDYVPLSYFGKNVVGADADTYKDLDFVQLNVDYPQIHKFLAQSFDTTDSLIRTFVSFQELRDNAAISIKRFPKIVFAPKSGVVVPEDDWQIRNLDGSIDYVKYEVVNDTIIYPPSNMDFKKVALVLHIEIISNGIAENPVKLRSLQLASRVLSPQGPNPVGTKFGADILPYRKSSELYDYKIRNPYSIYKGSTPYFYLTSTSGLQLKGVRPGELARGFELRINEQKASYFKVAAMQFALRFDDETFPTRITEIFEVQGKSSEDGPIHIKFYMVPDDNFAQRGRIYAIDANTGLQNSNVFFYINGKRVSNPVINARTWTILGIEFEELINFSGNEAAIRITGPILFNNLSYYQASQADEASRSVYRNWADVKILENLPKDWAYWKNLDADPGEPGTQTYTWRNLLIVSSEGYPGFDMKNIYQKYTGTGRIVIDTDSQFRLNNYKYTVYKDISWQSIVVNPA